MPLPPLAAIGKWLNDNQGVVSLAIFIVTLLLGWFSGIFSSLRRKPQFRIRTIDGPTFCCIYETGGEFNGHKRHQVGIAIYLRVSNVGSAPSSIEGVQIGYHSDLAPFSKDWLKYRIGWFWLSNFSASLEDFQVRIGENVKVYPYLCQKTFLSQVSPDTYLEPGKSVIGVVYFEQPESWGGFRPVSANSGVQIKIRVLDTFGRSHYKLTTIPLVDLAHARKFNPSFGKTHSTLAGTTLPFDSGI